MFNKESNKTQKTTAHLPAPEKLTAQDMETVTGGAGLRSAPKTKTTAISNDTKSKI